MKQYFKHTQRAYPQSFIEQVEKGEMTYHQAQKRYDIQGASTVLKWLHQYGHLDWQCSIRAMCQKII
jgi:transposase